MATIEQPQTDELVSLTQTAAAKIKELMAEEPADEIPGATLLTMEGMGHELPRGAWPEILPAIVAHTEGS